MIKYVSRKCNGFFFFWMKFLLKVLVWDGNMIIFLWLVEIFIIDIFLVRIVNKERNGIKVRDIKLFLSFGCNFGR